MTIINIHEKINNCYHQVDQITKDNPTTAMLYSIILKVIAVFLCSFSNLLGFSVFMISLTFEIALIKNFNIIIQKIKIAFAQNFSPKRRNARYAGNSVRIFFEKQLRNVKGFFEGFIPELFMETERRKIYYNYENF